MDEEKILSVCNLALVPMGTNTSFTETAYEWSDDIVSKPRF